MKVSLHNQSGEKIGTIDLSDEIFGVALVPELLHQAVVTQMANMRHVIAHAKDRSEVRGGGRKPWRQKGTGRARHGSRRSPIWVGGGATFGPTKLRNFKKKINKKMARKAVLMVLSAKAGDKELIVLDEIRLPSPKTKEMAIVVDRVVPDASSAILVLGKKNDMIARAGRNISDFKVINISNINILDLVNYKYLVITKDTNLEFEKKYATA